MLEGDYPAYMVLLSAGATRHSVRRSATYLVCLEPQIVRAFRLYWECKLATHYSSFALALMNDVTQILKQIEAGDSLAAGRLMPLVYEELRKLAAARLASERPNHTLQATALVHEAYIKLVGSDQPWEGRAHFFAAAANSMRQILVNWALAKRAEKRGGSARRVEMDDLAADFSTDPDMILDLDDALTRLAVEDSVAAELVKLRLFGGLSVTEAGQALNLSRTEAYNNWKFARAWFTATSLGSDEE